jgi:hypothetical protein
MDWQRVGKKIAGLKVTSHDGKDCLTGHPPTLCPMVAFFLFPDYLRMTILPVLRMEPAFIT